MNRNDPIDEFLANPEFNTVDSATHNGSRLSAQIPEEIPSDISNLMDQLISAQTNFVTTSPIVESVSTGSITTTVEYEGDDNEEEEEEEEEEEVEVVEEVVEQPQEQSQPNTEPPMVYDTVSDTTARFRGAPWFEIIQQQDISVIGVGGIGSYVGFLLSRLRPASISLTDDDRVEEANLSGQMYRNDDIEAYKVNALAGIIMNFSSYGAIYCNQNRVTAHRNDNWSIKKVTICGLDNMEARKICFTKWLDFVAQLSEEDKKSCLFIDGRLAMEEYQVYCIPGNSAAKQRKYLEEALFSGEEAEETVCSLKQTSFMACGIASMMVNLFVNFFCNMALGTEIRDVPFFTSYSGPCVYLKTE